MTEPVEYDCEGCGVHVVSFGIATTPEQRFCATCQWADKHLEPDELAAFTKTQRKLWSE
jgi:hypothetical protein